jgi:effector-binding domain-containing protein
VGAKALWSGGSLEIVGADPLERVRMRLELGTARPAAAELHLLPDTDTTRVIWSYDTDVGTNPLARYFGRWFDGAIGPQLEVGLTRLKSVAEQLPRGDFADLEVTLVDAVPVLVAYTEGPSGGDALASLGSAYARIDKFLADRRLTQAGARIRVPASREESGPAFEAAVPIEHEPEKPVPANSPVQVHRSPGGTALRAVHRGPLADVPKTYGKLVAFAAAHGHELVGATWDEFASDPRTTPEADLVTHVFVAVKPAS